MYKRLFPTLLLALTLLTTSALALPTRPESGYVSDGADVISTETADYINEKNAALAEATGGVIAVVSVDFMDGMKSDEYANQLFNDWGIGDKDRQNGLLLVFAVGENKARALQGTGLENDLTTTKLSDWMDGAFFPEYDAQNYDAGVLAFFDKAYAWYEGHYAAAGGGTSVEGGYAPGYGGDYYYDDYDAFSIGFLLFPIVVIVLIALLCDGMRYGRYRRRYMGPGMPPPPIIYYPLFFGRRHYHGHHNNHRGPGPGGFGGGGFGGGFGGGGSHGGGAGRGGGGFGGGFGGGGFGGGFGGGGARGGGAGR